MFDLTGKKILVTGSSQGIGAATAAMLAEAGAEVFVHASSSLEKAQKVCEGIVGKTHPVVADLGASNVDELLYQQTGDVDVLVLNASIQVRKPWDQVTEEEFNSVIRVNLLSTMKLIQKYVPHMKEQHWGRIICVGSIQQYKPHKDMLIYAASKEGQMSLVRNLAKQLSPFGITVNNMSPGTILTPRNSGVLAIKEYNDACLAGIPCGYIGEPKDCAGAVVLLASEEGRYINGIDILCDGGMHL